MRGSDSKGWHIAQDILSHIGEGKEFPPGAKLPDTRELCAQYKTSNNTIATALAYLVGMDIIYRRRGRGSWVRDKGST